MSPLLQTGSAGPREHTRMGIARKKMIPCEKDKPARSFKYTSACKLRQRATCRTEINWLRADHPPPHFLRSIDLAMSCRSHPGRYFEAGVSEVGR